MLGSGQDTGTRLRDQHRNHLLAIGQAHAAHTTGGTAHHAHLAFTETDGLAAVGKQHDVLCAIGNCGGNQRVTLVQTQRNQAGAAWPAELAERGFLHRTIGGSHKNVGAGRLVTIIVVIITIVAVNHILADDVIGIVFIQRRVVAGLVGLQVDLQHGGNTLAFIQRQQVDNRPATRLA